MRENSVAATTDRLELRAREIRRHWATLEAAEIEAREGIAAKAAAADAFRATSLRSSQVAVNPVRGGETASVRSSPSRIAARVRTTKVPEVAVPATGRAAWTTRMRGTKSRRDVVCDAERSDNR